MSNYLRWSLFTTAPLIGLAVIYVLWAEQLSVEIVKFIVSIVVINITLWLMAMIARKRPVFRLSQPNDTH